MTGPHHFEQSLAESHRHADAPWWNEVYRQAFPNMRYAHDLRADGWAQRAGVDRQILLRDGTAIEVDEKVRSRDWGDIALEYWSDPKRKVRGWIAKDLRCDYIAYAIAPTCVCYLLPFPLLRRAWRDNCHDWVRRYPSIQAENESASGYRYTTLSVGVPVDVLLGALQSSMVITWAKP